MASLLAKGRPLWRSTWWLGSEVSSSPDRGYPAAPTGPQHFYLFINTEHLSSASSPHSAIRRRGRSVGALVKFRRRNLRASLPCVFLSNVRSLKRFFLIQSNGDFKDCSMFCFTGTWLHPPIPDSAVQPPGYTLFRADRSPDLSNKSRGGED